MEKNIMFTITSEQLKSIINELYFIEDVVVDSVAKLDIKGDVFYRRKCKYLNQLRNKLEIVKNDKSSL
jgi:hypothetical protein